jgi:hypothetical protein
MEPKKSVAPLVKVGDSDGLGTVYSEWGGLIVRSGEEILRTSEGWDANVSSPWRRVLPKNLFEGLSGKASSKLYVTTQRIVLVRDIDVWRQVKGELTPLGLPAAAAKEIQLKKLKAGGIRQYCELRPQAMNVVKAKRINKRSSWLDLRLVGTDGRQYAITLWKTDGLDSETLALIESRFSHESTGRTKGD